MKIRIRKGVLAFTLLGAIWLPLLGIAASIDKNADKPQWMDWAFFGNTVISAVVTRWSGREHS